MMLTHLLTIFPLFGVTFATIGEGYLFACRAVEAAISDASNVYYPGSALYIEGDSHFFASSQQDSTCAVVPGTPEDVGKIVRSFPSIPPNITPYLRKRTTSFDNQLKVIDATKTPFSVKSGGHTVNRGFSSTQGIQIYTEKFSQVTYDAASGTAVIGTGLIWDTVYEKLQEHNVAVLGGRVTGIGVGGLLLGGGYSYKTNQYGLCIDTIVGFNLVLPNGTVTCVTHSTYPDLFWGLKGGFNNFGIVTDFTMKTFPQTQVWGGPVTYPSSTFGQVRTAIADFSAHSQDPKAAITSSYVSYQGNQSIAQVFFYDGPTPQSGTFDNFTNIPPALSDVKTRSYLDMLLSSTANATGGLRGTTQMLGVSHFTSTLLEAVESELTYWTTELTPKGGISFSYVVEPFLQSYLSHANSPSAWPAPSARKPGNAPKPLLVWFSWNNSLYDAEFAAAIEESANRLAAVAKAEDLLSNHPTALYGNYVEANTPLVDIYGDNLPKLRALKAKIDPKNVMDLAGGFKF